MKTISILLTSVILLSLLIYFSGYSERAISGIDIDSIANSILGNISVAVIFENKSIAMEIYSQLIGKVGSVDFYNVRDVDRALGRYEILFLAPEAVDRVSMNKSLVFKLVKSNMTTVLLDRDPRSLFRAFNSSEPPLAIIPINFTSNGKQIEPRVTVSIIESYTHRNLTRCPVSYMVFGEGYSKRYIDILRVWAKSRFSIDNQNRCGICVKAQDIYRCTCIADFHYIDSIRDPRGRIVGYQEYSITFAYSVMPDGQFMWRVFIWHHVYAIDSSYYLPLATPFGWDTEPNRIIVDVSKSVEYTYEVHLIDRYDQEIIGYKFTPYCPIGSCIARGPPLYLAFDHSDEYVYSNYYNREIQVRMKLMWGQPWYSYWGRFGGVRNNGVKGYIDVLAPEPFTPIITFKGVLITPTAGLLTAYCNHTWGFIVYRDKNLFSYYSLGTSYPKL